MSDQNCKIRMKAMNNREEAPECVKVIRDAQFGGERPLFGESNLRLENVTILPGESALKECRDIVAVGCEFRGKYLFWHTHGFVLENCLFTEGARAALWYSSGCEMRNCRVLAPKMFRELHGLTVENVDFPDAEETLWHCSGVRMRYVGMHRADYLFMHSRDIDIDHYVQEGNYSFQYCENVVIDNAEIHSKDAFWNTRNVTVRNSRLEGEYLGWYSEGLHLVNCHIGGTQPLCYCRGLRLENCTFDADADLAFEDSEVEATILSPVTSIKNPRTGHIRVQSVGEMIIDRHLRAPGNCVIESDR